MTREDHAELLKGIKANSSNLGDLLARSCDQWGYEDLIYRFYHHSYKVFGLQNRTGEIVTALRSLLPERSLNPSFLEIVNQGTGRVFSTDQSADWTGQTRPILEAFFHARFFLEMAVKYAELAEPPTRLPGGWAALLCLYTLR